jgi:hypothetical protein
MLLVAVSLLSGNLNLGANLGAKSARDLCSTLFLVGRAAKFCRAVEMAMSSAK